MVPEVKLVFDRSNEISDTTISFSSKNVFLSRSSGRMHLFLQNFLTAYPNVLLGEDTPSMVMQELAIQLFNGDKRTAMAGSIDIAYFGLNGTNIEWGVFVEVKSSFSLEKKFARFRRRKKRPPLPMSGTFKQIARHMSYISLMPGFDFSPGSNFAYFLVFPKRHPKMLMDRVRGLTSDFSTFIPLTVEMSMRLRNQVDGMLRLVEVYSDRVIFRESLRERSREDLRINFEVMSLYTSRNPSLQLVQRSL